MTNLYYLGVVGTALASAISQILLNISAGKPHKSWIFEYLNPWVITSYLLLFGTLAANIYLLRFMDLKVQNAIASSTYVFVMLLSRVVFGEKLTRKKVLGNLCIVAGILIFIQ